MLQHNRKSITDYMTGGDEFDGPEPEIEESEPREPAARRSEERGGFVVLGIPRTNITEVRVCLLAEGGRVSVRVGLWECDRDGRWWRKGRGATIQPAEIKGIVAGLTAADEAISEAPRYRRGRGRPPSDTRAEALPKQPAIRAERTDRPEGYTGQVTAMPHKRTDGSEPTAEEIARCPF